MDPSRRMSSQESVPTSNSSSTWGNTSPGSNTSLSMRSLFGSLPSSTESSTNQWNAAPWNSEGEDKAGNLPAKDTMSLFGWKPRPRANSEGGSSHLSQRKQEITNWINSQDASGSSWMTQGRVRRASSKDIEEAMTGGLTKADLYMPPM